MIRSAKSKGIDLPEVQKIYSDDVLDVNRAPKGGTGGEIANRVAIIKAFAKVV
jgi:hypothetical protein